MDVNAISNGDGGIFATTCCKTVTIGKQPVSYFENFKHTVMVSWMHNTAIDINNISREYNHREHRGTQRIREHRGTQRIGLKTLCSLCPLWLNPVAFTACVGSIRPQQNFKHTRSFVPTYPEGTFMQQVATQIVRHQNLDIFLPQAVAKLPSEYELTRALPENLKSSLPSIEELEAELSEEDSGDE